MHENDFLSKITVGGGAPLHHIIANFHELDPIHQIPIYKIPQTKIGCCSKQLEITPWNVEWTVAGVRSLTTLSLGRDGTSLLREIDPLTYQL